MPTRVRDDVTMTTSGDDSRMSRRTWSFVIAACWGALGLWAMSAGQTWLGLAQLALGVSFVAAALSPRVAAWDQAPLFRRKSSKVG